MMATATAEPTPNIMQTVFTPEVYEAFRQVVAEGTALGYESAAERLVVAPLKPVTVGLKGVCAMTTYSAATIWRMVAASQFPAPIDSKAGGTKWTVASIEEWARKQKLRKV